MYVSTVFLDLYDMRVQVLIQIECFKLSAAMRLCCLWLLRNGFTCLYIEYST